VYDRLIYIVDRGAWFRTDRRLYVGRRDRSHLADDMGWQVDAVRGVLDAAEFVDIAVMPVLCLG
jgi:hypothetical protein